MAELPSPAESEDTSMPRWVKVFGSISIAVVMLFVILLVVGGGRHGPGRHTPASSVEERGVQRP